MESVDNEDREAGTARYLSAKELLLEHTESDSGWEWSAKRKAELDV